MTGPPKSDKADFGAMFPRMFAELDTASILRSLRLASLDWLNRWRVDRMRAELDAWQSASYVGNVAIWPLWMIFGVESWLTRNHVTN